MTFWTEEKTNQLIAIKDTHSASRIADILGTTKNAVLGKIHRMKVNKPVVKKKPKPRKKPELKPRPVKKLIEQIDDIGEYTLHELKQGQCRAPTGDMKEGTLRFCGKEALNGSYCDHHRNIFYVKPKDYVKENKPRGENWCK